MSACGPWSRPSWPWPEVARRSRRRTAASIPSRALTVCAAAGVGCSGRMDGRPDAGSRPLWVSSSWSGRRATVRGRGRPARCRCRRETLSGDPLFAGARGVLMGAADGGVHAGVPDDQALRLSLGPELFQKPLPRPVALPSPEPVDRRPPRLLPGRHAALENYPKVSDSGHWSAATPANPLRTAASLHQRASRPPGDAEG